MPTSTPGATRRPLLLLLLAATLAVALWEWLPATSEPPVVDAPRDTARAAHRTLTPEERADSIRADSARRVDSADVARRWLGPQRWAVEPYSESSVSMIDVELRDSSMAGLMDAFVSIGALRDSAGEIALLGGDARGGRASLAGNVDSIVRAGAGMRLDGCLNTLIIPVRLTSGASAWMLGLVPDMGELAPPADSSATRHGAEALRLLEALPDTGEGVYAIDSLRHVAWPAPWVGTWRVDDVDVLVASRTRSSEPGGRGRFVQEQLVIAERPTGSRAPFTTVLPWHSAYDTDETRSMRIDGALRVGRARRFALLAGHAGKEGGGGALLVRTPAGWREAVSWEHGC